jgi:hypothetical protein
MAVVRLVFPNPETPLPGAAIILDDKKSPRQEKSDR